MSIKNDVLVKVTLSTLLTSTYSYNVYLGDFLNNSDENSLKMLLTSVGKDSEFITFPEENHIISVMKSQGFYTIVNEVLNLVVNIKPCKLKNGLTTYESL